jgi:uncharacterized repeat protein (TIGR01451 family)
MNQRSAPLPRFFLAKFIRISIAAAVLSLVALAAFYSPRTASSHAKKPSPRLPVKVAAVQETIATFAADCTTPKSSFLLGETVCAQTDNVDLNFPGGRWVHWLRQDLSIAHGSSTTTLITQNPQTFAFVPDQTGTWKVTIAETGDISQTPAVFTVNLAPESIATYESTCNFALDHFSTGDTVCAKVDPNFTGSRTIYWVDSQGAAVQTDIVSSTSPSATRTMTVAGNYWVYFSDSDGSLRSKHGFTVSDPTQPQVDLSVYKSRVSGDVVAGGFITYAISVANNGPDTASSVTLTDPQPQNLTFVSASQDTSGPQFTQGSPQSTWTIASLPAGSFTTFTYTYQVDSVAAGTEIVNTASISSTTQETHLADNSSSVAAVVTTGSPGADCSLDCPNDIITTATTHGTGGGANVTFGNAEGFGSCGTITASPTSGSFFPIGTTQVVVTSSTGGGGCSFTVTVVDTAAPTISCPSNISVTANPGQAEAFVPNPNGSSSNVGTPTTTGDQPLTVTGSREDGDALTGSYPIGVTNITWVAQDPSGRQATCTQRITVLPDHVLTISCPANVSVNSPNGCDPATGVNVGTATANSPTATITALRSDGQALNDPYPVGITTISWTATDTDTQSASCSQTVTVVGSDTTPPNLTAPPNISVSTSSCSVVLDDELGVATANDPDCGSAVSISRTGIPQVSCPTPQNPNQTCDSFVFPTGTTIITYTATNSSGLTTTATQTVTVTESPAIPPTIDAPANVTLFTGANATSCGVTVANLDATLGTATANDNCPGVVVTRIGVPAGNVFPVGTTTVTYRATDRSGNFAEDTQVVTVVDNTPPAISCPASITLEPTCPTGAKATWTAPVGTDNCPGATTQQTAGGASGSVFAIGTTTVTYAVTDAHGNGPVSCSFTVTVLTPQAVVQNLINAVNASSLTGTQKNGLLSKLNAALSAINSGQTNVACNKLSEFVNSVSVLINNGSLSAATGNAWISSANHVRNTIGCTNLPCS